ncbi:MAG: succinylglutamate desuccinylase/aspartoacylase family protein [Myxococcota bacterium]
MSVIFRLEAPYRGEYLLHRLTFGAGPPVAAFVAGLHGNEVNGIQALNLVAGMLRVQRPRGTVHLLPCVNTVGAGEARKRWPFDDRDIQAAFPGDAEGAAVERIAAAVMDATEASTCVDVQSGSTSVCELPHARVPYSGRALECARMMSLPVTWRRAEGRYEDGLVGAWQDAGRTGFQVRGGRGASLDMDDATVLARGLVRLLAGLGVLGGAEPPGPAIETDTVRDYRSSAGGFFVPEVRTGERVVANKLLGLLRAPLGGEPIEEVRATRAGVVLAVRVYPMVHAQELVVRVAEEPS